MFSNVQIEKGKTVVFIDEIQNCPRARTALKFLAIDKPFDVIASGSLLGIRYKEVPSFPVGYVNHLEMYSLDFEEFCWANGVAKEAVGHLKSYYDQKETIPAAVHERMLRLFREYIVVGGMPAAVNSFLQTHHFGRVLETQKGIIEDYLDDIAKYAVGNDKAKARECFLAIPRNLAKDYKKFRYSVVAKGGSARKFGGSLMWLYDAGIINFCYNLSIPELPLEGNSKSDEFKVYMRDTGLLVAMLEDGSQKDIMDGNLGIYKGAIYENIIADVFGKLGKKLYYFCIPNQIEVDFFIRKDRQATAVEVKSSENTKSKSMKNIIANYGVKNGLKLSTKNIGIADEVTTLPLYMAIFIND
jgi:predicted AAA+ superfamily ATPase